MGKPGPTAKTRTQYLQDRLAELDEKDVNGELFYKDTDLERVRVYMKVHQAKRFYQYCIDNDVMISEFFRNAGEDMINGI